MRAIIPCPEPSPDTDTLTCLFSDRRTDAAALAQCARRDLVDDLAVGEAPEAIGRATRVWARAAGRSRVATAAYAFLVAHRDPDRLPAHLAARFPVAVGAHLTDAEWSMRRGYLTEILAVREIVTAGGVR